MLQAGVMDYEFIIEDDDTTSGAPLSGWETVVFEVGDIDGAEDGDVAEGLEELIVSLYF